MFSFDIIYKYIYRLPLHFRLSDKMSSGLLSKLNLVQFLSYSTILITIYCIEQFNYLIYSFKGLIFLSRK